MFFFLLLALLVSPIFVVVHTSVMVCFDLWTAALLVWMMPCPQGGDAGGVGRGGSVHAPRDRCGGILSQRSGSLYTGERFILRGKGEGRGWGGGCYEQTRNVVCMLLVLVVIRC